ncbi:helix-turn-helix transcriptional regulator [Enterococcus avium]|uniref:helix-turn-helix transcriptional regulator n=1 Tax=Enterococcus avium TaxID=33945 RepID=UPI00288EF7BA|nr:helix-turn-helix transcriptional regulator [Enterococcus avium]MDT2427186.1 helix-turn-helix transcriptional regulator [Enterococcus avium]
MFEIDPEMAAKIRERRARKRLTLQQSAEEIGISRMTLGSIESGKRTRVYRNVYEKLVNWLVNEKVVN